LIPIPDGKSGMLGILTPATGLKGLNKKIKNKPMG
jgi:hypothetical protein